MAGVCQARVSRETATQCARHFVHASRARQHDWGSARVVRGTPDQPWIGRGPPADGSGTPVGERSRSGVPGPVSPAPTSTRCRTLGSAVAIATRCFLGTPGGVTATEVYWCPRNVLVMRMVSRGTSRNRQSRRARLTRRTHRTWFRPPGVVAGPGRSRPRNPGVRRRRGGSTASSSRGREASS